MRILNFRNSVFGLRNFKYQRTTSSLSGEPPIKPDNECKIDAKLFIDNNGQKWTKRRFFWHTLPFYYASASKLRLTSLVVMTTFAGCFIAPGHCDYSNLFYTTSGCFLCSSSANAINQLLEYPHDSQMKRTCMRILPAGNVSLPHIAFFSIFSGFLGVFCLYSHVNLLTTFLGLLNLLLYAFVYTPMKQISIYNTWVGSIVGALPPLAGYTSITGCMDLNAIYLGILLYFWQFPHFNSLSYLLKDDYSKAGYKMMINEDMDLTKKVTLKYSILISLLCFTLPYISSMVNYQFGIYSLLVNIPAIYFSYKFYKQPNKVNSIKLFKLTLVQLTLLLILLGITKDNIIKEM